MRGFELVEDKPAEKPKKELGKKKEDNRQQISVLAVGSSDITSYQPDILEYGIANFDTQLQFAEDDVLRQIREEWWERYRHTV